MDEIQRLRDRIDEIDAELTNLIKSRYETARLLGRIKRARGMSLRDPKREKIILGKVDRISRRFHIEPGLVNPIFRKIFKLSVRAQERARPQSSDLNGLRILIIGGTGKMGRFFTGFSSLHGARVKIAGRSLNTVRKAARELEVEPGTLLDAATSNIVVVSVPIEETGRVAIEAASFMQEGSLLLDISSVKIGSEEIAARISPKVEYVSVHPLFGPDVDHIQDQNIIAVPYLVGRLWNRLENLLKTSGANVYRMTATEHDRKMAYTQGLHHFAMMSLGITLFDKGGEPRTRSLRETERTITRMVDNWGTVHGIQLENPFLGKVRQEFAGIVDKLVQGKVSGSAVTGRRLRSSVQKWARKQ